ncbi:MAG: response regulator [Planctomycetota bacterium]|nr:response regulator [Planctomycetota bacterium]
MTSSAQQHPGSNGHAIDGPLRVLVADDEHLIATGMRSNLEDLGYEVVGPASDGRSAVEICRVESPDLAILDIRMPEVDGLEAAGTIFGEMGIPVVILSAYSDPEYVQAGNNIGIFGYLLKPVTKNQLHVGLEVAWARYRDWADQNAETEQLRIRLEQRKIIEQAKWVIVKRKDVEEPEAMRMLQRQARNKRKSLIDVAQAVVESESLLGE